VQCEKYRESHSQRCYLELKYARTGIVNLFSIYCQTGIQKFCFSFYNLSLSAGKNFPKKRQPKIRKTKEKSYYRKTEKSLKQI